MALLFMITSMLCWGSWANTMKAFLLGLRGGHHCWEPVLGPDLGNRGQTRVVALVFAFKGYDGSSDLTGEWKRGAVSL
jgi:hypothetical protein